MQANFQGAILIFGGNREKRENKIKQLLKQNGFKLGKDNPDLLLIENPKGKKSIGINRVRKAIKYLSQKPYMSEKKFIVVRNAHFLTRQAQNSFLKTLEEPPPYATILLETANKNELLDTVISRCQQIKIKPEISPKREALSLNKLKKISLGQRLDLAEKLAKKTRPEIISLVERWIESERQALKKANNTHNIRETSKNLEILEQARRDLNSTNVNTQLALEFLLLKVS